LVALMSLSARFGVPASTNCVLATLCVVVLPLATFALMRALFPQRRRLVELGAFATSAFSTWPWVFVIKGPCYPNLLGLSLMTAVLAIVVAFCEDDAPIRTRLLPFVLFSAIGLVALVLSHPNTLFTALVFLLAYGSHVIIRALNARKGLSGAKPLMIKALVVGTLWAAVVALWVISYNSPLLKSVLSYHWTENTSILKALISLFSLRLIVGGTQVVTCFLVLFGAIRCIRERQYWMIFTPAFFALCFVACRCGWESIKYWLAAIWYMTPYRFSALISLYCIPIAALGLEAIVQFVTDRPLSAEQSKSKVVARLWQPRTVLVIVFLLAIMPNVRIPVVNKKIETSFGRVSDSIHKIYAKKPEKVYSKAEVSFVDEAMEVIPEGALVLNSPNDGSLWAYGVNQLNTYYRNCYAKGQSEDATLIRTKLDEYATNEEVQEAVEHTGAQYVLLLDKGVTYKDGVWIPQYTKKQSKNWEGIDAIADDTPGFALVLEKDDDLRLYKIVGPE